MLNQRRVLVTGAGGFIGHHLTKYLIARDYWVRGVDVKRPEYEPTAAHEFELLDLRRWDNCLQALRDVHEVYALAAEMGGIGFIETHKAEIVRDSTMINIHSIEAARVCGVKRFLFTSSACIYPGYLQKRADVTPLKEDDAYPADAEDGYGWEKLYMERTCRHYREDFGLETRVVRFHNIFGPLGTYDGGREKSPAAICRKIALAQDGDTIEVWGDGEQTRSYCYIDDCVEGGRNSDNTRLRAVLGWEPSVSLEEGLGRTYRWIEAQLVSAGRIDVGEADSGQMARPVTT